jgi:hypothetical protein
MEDRRQTGSNPARTRRPGAASECPHRITIGMRCTRDLTDEQWETLIRSSRSQEGDVMVEADLGKAGDP